MVERFIDTFQKCGPDDAASAPEQGYIAVLQIPAIFACGSLHLEESLGITAELGSIECLADRLDEFLSIHRLTELCNFTLRPEKNLACSNALLLQS